MSESDGATQLGGDLGDLGRASNDRTAMRQALDTRILAILAVGQFHNTDLDREALRLPPGGEPPPPATLVQWVRDGGLWAKAIRIKWTQLMKLEVSSPVVLLLRDGSAALLTTLDVGRNVVWVKDPRGASGDLPVAVDELRLSQVWDGEVMLIRRERGMTDDTAPFNIGWLGRIVWQEKKILRDIIYGSVALSFLTIVPPLIVMTILNQVMCIRACPR